MKKISEIVCVYLITKEVLSKNSPFRATVVASIRFINKENNVTQYKCFMYFCKCVLLLLIELCQV